MTKLSARETKNISYEKAAADDDRRDKNEGRILIAAGIVLFSSFICLLVNPYNPLLAVVMFVSGFTILGIIVAWLEATGRIHPGNSDNTPWSGY